jgi:RHS repeat-associated protein
VCAFGLEAPLPTSTTGSAAQQRHSRRRQPTSQRSQRSTYPELPHSPAGAIAPRTNRGELVRRAGATPRAPACGGIINDPTGRLVRVDHPDGSYEKTTQGTWKTQTWDRNDTLDDEENLWRQARETLPTTDPRRIAYDKASAHAATPSAQYLDPLGRPVLSVAHHLDGAAAQHLATRTKLDLEGHPLSITDPLERLCQTHAYSIAGRLLRSDNIDSGIRHHLATVLGEACRRWDARDQRFRPQYDDLRRPTHLFLKVGSASETLLERRYYGDAAGLTDPQDHHLRGKLIALYDGAGLLELGPYDFKANLLATRRQLTTAYTSTPDWSPIASEDDVDAAKITVAAAIQTETFEELRTFDALNRVTSITTPDDSLLEPLYNEASLLEALSVYVRGATTATPIIKDLDYNAKGQRTRIEYSDDEGTAPFATEYHYDELTFRLKRLTTTRVSPSNTLQDLRYEFDPVGNIIRIQDDAQQSLFYDDAFVAPENLYTYDAVYRLIEATGREHASIGTTQLDHQDQPIRNLPLPTDPSAVRSYQEQHTYDRVGNLLELFHSAGGGANTWTRTYSYTTGTNQLASNTIPGGSATYTHDAHGSITSMPHLASITYGPFDQMQSADLGGGGDAYYQYDASGQRVRKLIDTGANLIKERIYLGAYEIYREHISGDIDLERQSLHVMDGTRRVALLETLTIEDGNPVTTPVTHQRFQLGNHLDSALLEVDETGLIISYEEYAPYGTAAYRSTRSGVEVSARRYRYTGKERDDETGLYYHGARYYAAWLGRWTSADPLGIGADGPGLYNYTRGSPVVYSDPSGTDSVDDQATLSAAHQQLAEQEYHRYLAEQYAQHDLEAGQTIDPSIGVEVPGAVHPQVAFANEMLANIDARLAAERAEALTGEGGASSGLAEMEARDPFAGASGQSAQPSEIGPMTDAELGFWQTLGGAFLGARIPSGPAHAVGALTLASAESHDDPSFVLGTLAVLPGMPAVSHALDRATGAAADFAYQSAFVFTGAGGPGAGGGAKTPVPTTKSTPFGPKIADEIPGEGVPLNWSRSQIQDAITDYSASIASRKTELQTFEAAGVGSATQRLAHARRITQEESFLRSLKKALERRSRD